MDHEERASRSPRNVVRSTRTERLEKWPRVGFRVTRSSRRSSIKCHYHRSSRLARYASGMRLLGAGSFAEKTCTGAATGPRSKIWSGQVFPVTPCDGDARDKVLSANRQELFSFRLDPFGLRVINGRCEIPRLRKDTTKIIQTIVPPLICETIARFQLFFTTYTV